MTTIIRFILFALVGSAVAYWTWAWTALFTLPLDNASVLAGAGVTMSVFILHQLIGVYRGEKEAQEE
jgi:hypothetical protein